MNLLGAYNTVRAALPAVSAAGYLAVTASLASFAHAPRTVGVRGHKAGVEAMCNSLRIEVAHHGVDVATIHPTWIDTDMVREGDEHQRSFQLLRDSMTTAVQAHLSARACGDGHRRRASKRRKRRICTPQFVVLAHCPAAAAGHRGCSSATS